MNETKSCCGPTCCGNDGKEDQKSAEILSAVQSKYGAVARGGLSSEQAGVREVAKAFGYSADEIASIPAEANMGLSCGNPTATAHLRAGEVVVDLGSGGGLDVFLAAQKTGPTGKAIGIDMTADMVDLSRRNAIKSGITNVEFYHSTIDRIPLSDNSVDVVISNCVINLAPDKPAVFREIFRILKPGGRVAVSDIALKKTLPTELGNDLMAYVGCIAGATAIETYRQQMIDAGFSDIAVVDTKKDLNAYAKVENQSGCCSPVMDENPARVGTALAIAPVEQAEETLHSRLSELLKRYDVNEYAASVQVYAIKPR